MSQNIANATEGSYFILDHPTTSRIKVQRNVVSLRGWAWARGEGAGRLWIEVQGQTGGGTRILPISHRYCRFDISRAIPEIPLTNYAGFEISIDRFQLPAQASLVTIFVTAQQTYRLEPIQVTAAHDDRLEAIEDVPCDCCGGQKLSKVGEKEGLSVQQCQNCGLVFTSPRPEMAAVYQRYSNDYFEREYLPEIHTGFEERRQHWNNMLLHLERFKSLSPYYFEVGTGAGYLLREAALRGWVVSGLDVNPSAVRYAQELGLKVSQGDIHSAQLPSDHFGAIMLDSTLEHFLSPRQVLAACAQALCPGGGIFIWTLGNEGDLFLTTGMDFCYVGPSEHLYYFPTSALSRLCEQVGLRVESFWRDSTGDSVALVATKRIDRWDR